MIMIVGWYNGIYTHKHYHIMNTIEMIWIPAEYSHDNSYRCFQLSFVPLVLFTIAAWFSSL